MPYTYIIIALTVMTSMLAFKDSSLYHKLLLWPKRMDKPVELYRFVSSGFIHADWMHLFFNMFTLFFFGRGVEQMFELAGIPVYYFVILYISGIIISSVPSFFKHRNDVFYRSLGASGGVAAVLFSYVYFAPWNKILVFFIPIPAILAAVAYLFYSAYMSRRGGDSINHDAHFWGAIFGFLFTLVVAPDHGRIFLLNLLGPFS